MAQVNWTHAEVAYLHANVGKQSDDAIAAHLGRSPGAVARKRRTFRVQNNRQRAAATERQERIDAAIREHWGKMPVQEVAALAGETYGTIATRARKMGMPRLDTSHGGEKSKGLAWCRVVPKGYSAATLSWAKENATTTGEDGEIIINNLEAAAILAVTGRDGRWR
jgi:hypothetical protein